MTYITGQPIVFVGTGQTYTDLKSLNVQAVISVLLKWLSGTQWHYCCMSYIIFIIHVCIYSRCQKMLRFHPVPFLAIPLHSVRFRRSLPVKRNGNGAFFNAYCMYRVSNPWAWLWAYCLLLESLVEGAAQDQRRCSPQPWSKSWISSLYRSYSITTCCSAQCFKNNAPLLATYIINCHLFSLLHDV